MFSLAVNADDKHRPEEVLRPLQCHSAQTPLHLHHCGDDGDDASSFSYPSLLSPFSASSSCVWMTSKKMENIRTSKGQKLNLY